LDYLSTSEISRNAEKMKGYYRIPSFFKKK
jgi:hypothetical protein